MGRSRRPASTSAAPDSTTAHFLARVEALFGLVSRHGLAAPEVTHDRAETMVLYRGDPVSVRTGFYGLQDFANLGIALVPARPDQAFSLDQAMAALEPAAAREALTTTEPLGPGLLDAWLEPRAAFFEAHAQALLHRPAEVFDRVRQSAPLGAELRPLLAELRERLALEPAHGFDPPQAVHWRHQVEIDFRKPGLRVQLRFEDHENAGVPAPFTAPVLTLCDDAEGVALPLSRIIEHLDPEHHAATPTLSAYAVARPQLRPVIEHLAAFLAAHPELLTDATALRDLAARLDPK